MLGIPLYVSPLGFNWDAHNNSWVLPPVTADNVALTAGTRRHVCVCVNVRSFAFRVYLRSRLGVCVLL